MSTLLYLNKVSKSFGKQAIIKDLSMTVQKGDIYGLIGRNGSGKTTTLKMIVRLIRQDKGEISLFNQTDERSYLACLSRTSSMIEEPVAFKNLSAYQNLMYYCKLRGIVDSKSVIAETLDLVGLTHVDRKPYKNFSLGMKQKLGLAIALLSKPDLVILDEPLNGLDPIAIVELRELILKLNEELGITFIISSHILSELFLVANKFGFIKDGQMVQEMSKEEFTQINRKFIVLETVDSSAMVYQLDQLGILDYKVVNPNIIHIFDETYSIAELSRHLLENGLDYRGIYYSQNDLEAHFSDLLGTDRQGGAR